MFPITTNKTQLFGWNYLHQYHGLLSKCNIYNRILKCNEHIMKFIPYESPTAKPFPDIWKAF